MASKADSLSTKEPKRRQIVALDSANPGPRSPAGKEEARNRGREVEKKVREGVLSKCCLPAATLLCFCGRLPLGSDACYLYTCASTLA
jgi:hypothetical protein